jgi:DnaK suppressor protein
MPPTGVEGIRVTIERIVASHADATIDVGRSSMELEQARSLLTAEQARLRESLADVGASQADDRQAESETGDVADPATSLEAQGIDDAVAASLRDRLAAVERALQRVDDGTYGRSIRSGVPIPDARLEADPSAELTVEEAAADEASQS